ncbi:MAG: PQQ-dependent sugar dehydrogenase [Robiginitomaculum sp.]|nr:PQQ-dependent sugar dehydrogenase [Robiginitomaculum sp.]
MNSKIWKTWIGASLLAGGMAACTAANTEDTPFSLLASVVSEQANFDVVQVTDQLDKPWGLAFLPNGDFLVTQKTGQLVRVAAKSGAITSISGMPEILVLGQGGLLDVALSPNFAEDQALYISYASGTRDKNHTVIAKAVLTDNALTTLDVIFEANTEQKSGGHHFGSRFAFDNQGHLYASIGDGGRFEDEAQNPLNHFGTIIRLHLDGSIPADNPFADGVLGAPEVWSYGHRNPQGVTTHPSTGEIWSSEHGPKGGDEVNLIAKGENYGWPKASFGRKYTGGKISDFSELPGMVSPLLHWTPSIAASGLSFYSGTAFANWNGDLFSGALAGRHLRRVELDGYEIVAQEELLGDLKERIRDVRMGPDGFLYLLADSGKLLRLEPTK